ncbi:MAG: Ig-like domain-containing protein, partial [Thermoplasmatota archaeon]
MFVPRLTRGAHFLMALLFLTSVCPPASPSEPSLVIDSPEDGAVLLNSTVNVTGRAEGSTKDWTQTSAEDFAAGEARNLTIEPSGELRLQSPVFDDFDDGTLDPLRWREAEAGGIEVVESGGRLFLGGSSDSIGCWTAVAEACTTAQVSSRVSAELWSFTGSGSGYRAGFGLRDASGNEILLELARDFELYGDRIKLVLAYSISGSACETALEDAAAGVHTYTLLSEGGRVYAYRGSTQLGSFAIDLSGPVCVFRSRVYTIGGMVGSEWDNVTCFYSSSGGYASSVFDTGSPSPALTRVSWSEVVPAGTQLLVRVRSSPTEDMAGAAWANVSNGQTSELPQATRYIQYSLEMGSPGGLGTPLFREIQFEYRVSVLRVEVSTDNRSTWVTAEGTEEWSALLELPDGHHTLWARVTDYDGEIKDESVELDVDTTPPTGSILIELGALMTPIREVQLQLRASDAYGLWSMMLSESPDFEGAQWQSYSSWFVWNLSEGDGNKTVYVRYKDVHGLVSGVYSDSIVLDTTPPTGAVLINGGAVYTSTTSVRLTLDALDLFEVTDMMVSNKQSLDDAEWLLYQRSMFWELRPGDGERSVYAVFRDAAGHTSSVASDSIILDTTPPSLSLSLEGGAEYVRDRNVTLSLDASDNYGAAEMMVSTSPTFAGASWEAFSPTRELTLPPEEGLVRVYARVRDFAGNQAEAVSDPVTYDGTPPSCVVSTLPPVTETENFTVRWNGADETSGVRSYDVQYMEAGGLWTDWYIGVNFTSAVFTGRHNGTYSFRARARDNAGNVGSYPEVAKATTTVRLPWVDTSPLVVSVSRPAQGASLAGKATITGTAANLRSGGRVALVQIQIDGGHWLDAAGTESWSFVWDTTKVRNGPHILRVRASDGENYSDVAEVQVTVSNRTGAAGAQASGSVALLAVVVAAAAAAGAGVILFINKRKAPAARPAPG